jgi:hypothetical protein
MLVAPVQVPVDVSEPLAIFQAATAVPPLSPTASTVVMVVYPEAGDGRREVLVESEYDDQIPCARGGDPDVVRICGMRGAKRDRHGCCLIPKARRLGAALLFTIWSENF